MTDSSQEKGKLSQDLQLLLESERRLCKRLKDNYEVLKEKYRSLQEEYTHIRTCFDNLQKGKEETDAKNQAELAQLTGQLSRKVVLLESEQSRSKTKFEEFKNVVKKELGDYYGKLIHDITAEFDQLKSVHSEVLAERAKLSAELEACEINQKHTEEKLQSELESVKYNWTRERQQLLDRIDSLSNEGTKSKLEADVQKFRQLWQELKQSKETVESELNERNKQLNDTIVKLNSEMHSLKISKHQLELNVTRVTNESKFDRNKLETVGEELRTVKQELDLCKREKLKQEIEFEKKLLQNELDFRTRITDIESDGSLLAEQLKEKDKQIEKMTRKISEIELSKETMAKSQQIDIKHDHQEQQSNLAVNFEEQLFARKKLEQEKELKWKEKEHEMLLKIRQIEWERNRMEQDLVRLRKLQNETIPLTQKDEDMKTVRNWAELKEAKIDISFMRTELARKDAEIKKLKKHYRSLLKQMKNSYRDVLAKLEKLKLHLESEQKPGKRHGNSRSASGKSEMTKLKEDLVNCKANQRKFAELMENGEKEGFKSIEKYKSARSISSSSSSDNYRSDIEADNLDSDDAMIN